MDFSTMGETLKEILFKFKSPFSLFRFSPPYLSLNVSADYQKYCCLNGNLFIYILLSLAGSNCQEVVLIS